jgi:hypothetical protein
MALGKYHMTGAAEKTAQIPTPETTRGDPTARLPQRKTISISNQMIRNDRVAAPSDEGFIVSTMLAHLRDAQSDIANVFSLHFDDCDRDL